MKQLVVSSFWGVLFDAKINTGKEKYAGKERKILNLLALFFCVHMCHAIANSDDSRQCC